MASPTISQLTEALVTAGLPMPSSAFLSQIVTPAGASKRVVPLAALIATAKHRLLSSDITAPNVHVASKVLVHDTPTQVVDVEDLGKSNWEQVESLEAERKGEMTKGREIIRVATQDEAGEYPAYTQPALKNQSQHNGPFRLLLQDVKGQTVYAFELRRVEKIGMPCANGHMHIGAKIVLRKGMNIARGMILLEPGLTDVLGGKVEALDKAWREGREKKLRDVVRNRRRTEDGHDP